MRELFEKKRHQGDHTMLRMKRGLVSLTVLLLVGIFALPSQADTKSSLQKLAGWTIPGLENIEVGGLKAGKNYFSAELPAVANGKIKTAIVGFKSDGLRHFNVGIVISNFHLGDFSSAIRATPLNDLTFTKMILLAIPRENANRSVAVPPALKQYLGTRPVKKPAGVKLFAAAKATGKLRELVNKIGLNINTLKLNGSINPGIFAGKFKASRLSKQFLDALDLTVPLPVPRPSWRPSFLSFSGTTLSLKGHDNGITASVSSEIEIKAKQTLKFAPVTIAYDSVARKLTLDGAQAQRSAALKLPLSNARVTGLAFAAEIAGNEKKFSLTGDLALGGKTHPFDAELSGSTQASYEIELKGDFALSDFGAGNLPGLDKIKVSDPKIANHYASAGLSIGNVATTLVAYTPEGKRRPNVALLSDGLKISDLAPGAKGTPLDDLQLGKTGFVVAPASNAGNNQPVPEIVTEHLGVTSLNLKSGVNIRAAMSVAGKVKEVMSALKLPTTNLPLTGKFDPSIFKQPKSLAKSFMQNLDLSVPLNKLRIPGAPDVLKLSNSALVVKGSDSGIEVSVATDASIHAGGRNFEFEQVFVDMKTEGGQRTFEIAGSTNQRWSKAFGLSWLTLGNIGLDVKLGTKQDIAITGVTSIGRVRNLKASANLEIKGGKVADFGISLTGADIPISSIPGLNKLPNAGDFAVRDLVISEKEFAGTSVSKKHKAFDGLELLIFDVGTGWNFALLHQKFTLADILPISGPAK
ncbi:MAG TPA: hypothetical protein DCS82_02580, partial [Rhodospirillaceae bacterium]|nr:hypothetical protein [Rhodospirillaceae bacterium]